MSRRRGRYRTRRIKDLADRIAKSGNFDDWQIVVIHDKIEYARSTEKFLWATWTRFDPASDIFAKEVTTKNNHIGYTAPIVIDARMKPWYPAEVEPREDIVEARRPPLERIFSKLSLAKPSNPLQGCR